MQQESATPRTNARMQANKQARRSDRRLLSSATNHAARLTATLNEMSQNPLRGQGALDDNTFTFHSWKLSAFCNSILVFVYKH